MTLRFPVSAFLVLLIACQPSSPRPETSSKIKVGAQVLIEDHLNELRGKRIGLVMNPTARIGSTHMLDTLLALNINVTALFAPEHGFRGDKGAGEEIENGIDKATGLPVYSLYGAIRKPTPAMLQNVDLLLFDMQDVGARFYTYNVTLGLVLEAAAAAEVPVWILDRPDPAGGNYVAGWMLQDEYKSFVGAYPIPMAYGMTLGELAKMMIGEKWIDFAKRPDLKVIPVKNWHRSMKWPETGLQWYPPSPNLPAFENAYIYLGTVLFEGTNISEGRGTDDPFLTIGSPQTKLSDKSLAKLRNQYPGLKIERTTFTPRSIPGKALHPKYEGQLCMGVKIDVEDYTDIDPVDFGVALLKVMLNATEGGKMTDYIYDLAGSEKVSEFRADWKESVNRFLEERKQYLIY